MLLSFKWREWKNGLIDDIELLKSIMNNTSNLGIDFKFNYKLSSAKGAASAIKNCVKNMQ